MTQETQARPGNFCSANLERTNRFLCSAEKYGWRRRHPRRGRGRTLPQLQGIVLAAPGARPRDSVIGCSGWYVERHATLQATRVVRFRTAERLGSRPAAAIRLIGDPLVMRRIRRMLWAW